MQHNVAKYVWCRSVRFPDVIQGQYLPFCVFGYLIAWSDSTLVAIAIQLKANGGGKWCHNYGYNISQLRIIANIQPKTAHLWWMITTIALPRDTVGHRWTASRLSLELQEALYFLSADWTTITLEPHNECEKRLGKAGNGEDPLNTVRGAVSGSEAGRAYTCIYMLV